MARWLLATALAVAVGASGCLDPFQAHVDPGIVASAGDWLVVTGDTHGNTFDGKWTSVRYTFDPPEGDQPPFTGLLVLFSLRGLSRMDVGELLARAETAVEDFAAAQGLDLQGGHDDEGTRTLANDATSTWFTRTGSASGSGLIEAGETVRILGESWYDGVSRTSVVAVGVAQITKEGTLFGLQDVTDLRTWRLLAGDPAGTIDNQRGNGFVYNVVSHD